MADFLSQLTAKAVSSSQSPANQPKPTSGSRSSSNGNGSGVQVGTSKPADVSDLLSKVTIAKGGTINGQLVPNGGRDDLDVQQSTLSSGDEEDARARNRRRRGRGGRRNADNEVFEGSLPVNLDVTVEAEEVQYPSEERTVHLRFLPVSMTRKNLRDLVEKCGPVLRLRACSNPKKDQNWIYGFVEYARLSSARAMLDLDGSRIENYRLRCNTARSPIGDKLPTDATTTTPCTFGRPGRDRFYDQPLKHADDRVAREEFGAAGWSVTDGTRSADTSASRSTDDLSLRTGWSSSDHSALERRGPAVRSLLAPVLHQMTNALTCGALFVKERHQTYFFQAISSIGQAIELGSTIVERISGTGGLDTQLVAEETLLCARVIAIALHVHHFSLPEAVSIAQAALSAITIFSNTLDAKKLAQCVGSDAAAVVDLLSNHHRFVVNHLIAIGLLFEPHSAAIARSFYTVAQRRAATDLRKTNDTLDTVLDDGSSFLQKRFRLLGDSSYAVHLLSTASAFAASSQDARLEIPPVAPPVFA